MKRWIIEAIFKNFKIFIVSCINLRISIFHYNKIFIVHENIDLKFKQFYNFLIKYSKKSIKLLEFKIFATIIYFY